MTHTRTCTHTHTITRTHAPVELAAFLRIQPRPCTHNAFTFPPGGCSPKHAACSCLHSNNGLAAFRSIPYAHHPRHSHVCEAKRQPHTHPHTHTHTHTHSRRDMCAWGRSVWRARASASTHLQHSHGCILALDLVRHAALCQEPPEPRLDADHSSTGHHNIPLGSHTAKAVRVCMCAVHCVALEGDARQPEHKQRT